MHIPNLTTFERLSSLESLVICHLDTVPWHRTFQSVQAAVICTLQVWPLTIQDGTQ